MNIFGSFLLGRLNWSAFQHAPITMGAVFGMVLLIIAIPVMLTWTHRWKWLYKNWLTTTDPKRIGTMYLISAMIMLFRGGSDALLIRTQQATSVGASHGIVDSNTFQQIFSAHGTIMIFFAAMGLMFGLINLVVPMQIGARDVAFPFMNATSFWLYAAGAALINISLAIGVFSGAGWLAYPPLSELQYSPGVGVDYWIWGLQIAGVGSLMSGINFFVTIVKMRCKGMSLMKLPMFTWSVMCAMTLVMFAFPILTVTLTLLALDRLVGTHFFTSSGGSNVMMYVNLIWAWGHPEVYILILPAFGVFSEVVATFSRKRLFGYTSMVVALWAIVVLSFTVWLHHFFTMGAGGDVNGFFGIMTMVIAVPTGVKIFNWLFTMYRGRIHFATPMLWFLGFLFTFTVGGVAGVILALPPADFQLHNSLFLVAHFHTMIIGGVVFGYFAGMTYWFPKFYGFKLNEYFGRWAFGLWQTGYAFAFIPLYILGLMGATRRLDNYSPSLGWQPLFIVAGIGAAIIALAFATQIFQFIISFLGSRFNAQNQDVTGDPWNGRTLEWSTVSPPPFYNFAVLPEVTDRDSFWVSKHSDVKPKKVVYEDIELPKNTPAPLIIAGFALMFGFAIVWHIWWMAAIGFLGLIVTLIVRLTDDNTEYTIPAKEIERLEKDRLKARSILA
jgi:cytochrome o ubiquinol oxidase subunit 1